MVVFFLSHTDSGFSQHPAKFSPHLLIDLAPSLVRTPRRAWISTGRTTRPPGWHPCIFSMTTRGKVRVIRVCNKALQTPLIIMDQLPVVALGRIVSHPLPPPWGRSCGPHRRPRGLYFFGWGAKCGRHSNHSRGGCPAQHPCLQPRFVIVASGEGRHHFFFLYCNPPV